MTDHGIVTIESGVYEETRKGLMEDPVIRAMAKGVPRGVDMTSWEFISRASHYYSGPETEADRTWHGPLHIGGPAEAIRRLKEADGTARDGVVL